MSFDALYRRTMLGLASYPPIERFMRGRGLRLGVSRFVAGASVDDAVEAAQRLESSGMRVILDLLGEFIDDKAGVQAMRAEILRGLDAISKLGSPAMSVKPTQLGLGIDAGLALDNARVVAERAREVGAAVCLDMESHPFVDGTLELYRSLHAEGFRNVSTVLQSYLRRSESDLETLLELDPPPAIRIVKGAYREPAEVAFQDKSRVDSQFRKLALRLLEGGGKANIATHDESILQDFSAAVAGAKSGTTSYEYQLLYGVKPALQRSLLASGHPVRIYVPYGSDWYGYFSRRLAERPANLSFVVRGLFG